ncbi:probable proton-coupled zinc antiporter SLC30A3 [Melopsittacus undulatus]|uniref:probable proton-coupled zinc antiporter SLC30A3 n=1 Tax=Melopsittacus undulatus TaxID=13146 RepID=UPI00146E8742|nr:zinc transporter 3 [Melopsittacus undulatus]
MEPPTRTESSRLVNPRDGHADGSLRLKRYRQHRHPIARHLHHHLPPAPHHPGTLSTSITGISWHRHRRHPITPALVAPSPSAPGNPDTTTPPSSPASATLYPTHPHSRYWLPHHARHLHHSPSPRMPAPLSLSHPEASDPIPRDPQAPVTSRSGQLPLSPASPSTCMASTSVPPTPAPSAYTNISTFADPKVAPTVRVPAPLSPTPAAPFKRNLCANPAPPSGVRLAEYRRPSVTHPQRWCDGDGPGSAESSVAVHPDGGARLRTPVRQRDTPVAGLGRAHSGPRSGVTPASHGQDWCFEGRWRSATGSPRQLLGGPDRGSGSRPRAPSPGRGRLQARRQLSIACTLCCIFMIGEVIGGYLAHSLAIMTDAAHLLTDIGSMSVSLFSLWVSTRPPTKIMSFGWHRSETLGALASVLSIWVVTGALVYLAAARIISNDYEIEARAMLATSASAVGVNLVMAYILHQSPVSHGHGHSTGGYEQLESTGGCLPSHVPLPGSTSVRAAFVHVVGDLLQSISVLVAATIIYFKPQCKIADPISTLFFSVFVLGSTFTILRDVFRVLMEGTPRDLEFDAVKEMLLAVNGVKGVHDLHLWALTLSHHTMSVHVAVDTSADPEMVLHEATTQLQSRFGFASCTVQVERYQEEMMGCQHCKDPCA